MWLRGRRWRADRAEKGDAEATEEYFMLAEESDGEGAEQKTKQRRSERSDEEGADDGKAKVGMSMIQELAKSWGDESAVEAMEAALAQYKAGQL